MTTVVPSAAATAERARWAWMDNLRVAVITGVIVVHVAVVYAVDFSWFYEERTAHPLTQAVLSVAVAPGFLFGMAVLFFVAGMGSHRSLARKGARRFLHDRLVRLGIPLVVIVVVMEPVLEFMGSRAEGEPAADDGWGFLRDELASPATAHGWFIAALLVFSVVHAIWRSRRPARTGAGPLDRRIAVSAAVAIAVGSFAVRLAWPVGEANPLALNLWEWPQMATLYTLGVLASERRWLDPMPDSLRRAAARGAAAGVGSAVVLAGLIFVSSDGGVYVGGSDPRALALPLLEAVLAISMSFWLLGWFPRRWNQSGPLAQALGRASFGAYVIHLPVVVWLSVLLRDVAVPAEAKLVVVTVVGVAASFSLAWIAQARGRRSLLAAVRRHPLPAFFAAAFAASWGYWIPVAAAGGHWSHFPGLLGPMVAAVIVTAATRGRAGVRDLAARMTRWRAPLSCYGAAAVIGLAAMAAIGIRAVAGADMPSWRELSDMPGLPAIGWLGVFALAVLINGFGEETGWRGFAWGELRRRHTMAGAALLLAVPWAVWHVPTFWIDSGMRGFPPLMIPGFLIGLAAGAVVLGDLYERSGSSVFVVAVWHAMVNMASAAEGTEGFVAAAVSAVVIFWAVRILRLRTS